MKNMRVSIEEIGKEDLMETAAQKVNGISETPFLGSEGLLNVSL